VLGKARAGHIVDGAASIGAKGGQPCDILAETRLRARLHDVGEPVLQGGDHRTIDRHRPFDADRAARQARKLERMVEAANPGPVDLVQRLDIGGRLNPLAGEASLLRLHAPGRTLGPLVKAAADEGD
jgi:hypothetical protein